MNEMYENNEKEEVREFASACWLRAYLGRGLSNMCF